MPNKISEVWYHANCPDGFAAAWAAWLILGEEAVYRAVRHGDEAPEVAPGAHLAIVDFSYPRRTLLELEGRVERLLVLDHHRSAALELEGLPFARFEMDSSGARMAWEFWHPEEPLPELLAYIEDRDLWRWKLPKSREVSLALSVFPFDFELWSSLSVEGLKVKGEALQSYQDALLERAASRVRWQELAGYRIPTVNSCLFPSELGDLLCLKYPEAPFAGVYYDKMGEQAWSLRSIGDFDVSEVAKRFGGGGHRNAAGFAAEGAARWIP